jgi:hypothetical protein
MDIIHYVRSRKEKRCVFETNTVGIVWYVKGVLDSTASGGSQIGDFVNTLINIVFHK